MSLLAQWTAAASSPLLPCTMRIVYHCKHSNADDASTLKYTSRTVCGTQLASCGHIAKSVVLFAECVMAPGCSFDADGVHCGNNLTCQFRCVHHSARGRTWTLTPSTPAVPICCCFTGLAPYWSNPLFLIFDIRTLWRSVLSTRASECQKLKIMG